MASIIIVSFNTRDLTRACLESLQVHEPNAEVIVVDNDSHDDSVNMIRNEFPGVKLIELSKNVGFGGANNVGYEHATHETIILLNSDTVVEDNSLSRCEDYLYANKTLGSVSPRLVGMDGQPQQARHRFPTISDHVRKAFRGQPAPVDEVPEDHSWLAGTCLVMKREAIEKAGGLFDHHLFMYWEDADLSSRLLKSGWTVDVFEDAWIRHYGGASGGGPDGVRRPDLHAWYTFGRHHWFAQHRPLWECVTLWTLEFLDTFRCFVRGALHKERRNEWIHAKTMASVLLKRLIGGKPGPIGGSKKPKQDIATQKDPMEVFAEIAREQQSQNQHTLPVEDAPEPVSV